MTFWLWVTAASALGLCLMLAVAIFNLLTARRLHRAPGIAAPAPGVSVLIPARNEAATLRVTLPLFAAASYPDLEVLVLDDCSTDGTAEVVEEIAGEHGRIRLLRGTPPPAGWLGKCWACHQLASSATGRLMIFCDADVSIGPLAIQRTVATMEMSGAGLLTALPKQITPGWLEASLVPLIAQLPVIALLPLRLVESTWSPSLSMGNGQWMAFTRDAYARSGGHAMVRDRVLEDVWLARAAKASGERLVVALARNDLGVRMYHDARALREGFRKNLYLLAGGNPLGLITVLTFFAVTMLYPLAAPFIAGWSGWILVLLLAGVRITGCAASGHRWSGVVLHPLGATLAPALALDSAIAAHRGEAVWKGRPVRGLT
jgi:glycosyltransferase involved in cell wall biosynthesis